MREIEIWFKGERVEGGFDTIKDAKDRVEDLKKNLVVEVIEGAE